MERVNKREMWVIVVRHEGSIERWGRCAGEIVVFYKQKRAKEVADRLPPELKPTLIEVGVEFYSLPSRCLLCKTVVDDRWWERWDTLPKVICGECQEKNRCEDGVMRFWGALMEEEDEQPEASTKKMRPGDMLVSAPCLEDV